jgi:hypothetical protein
VTPGRVKRTGVTGSIMLNAGSGSKELSKCRR